MLEITDNTVVITKDDGTEDLWKIYFYYHNSDRNKDFFFLFKEEDPDSLIVMASADHETLEDVTPEELEEAQEMLNTYEDDPEIQEIK